MKLAFIGGGAMAEAIINGVLTTSLAQPQEISVSDIVESRCRYLTDRYRVFATTQNAKVLKEADLLVLAVKPQNLSEVAEELHGALDDRLTVLSIIAGARMSTLTESLGHQAVIRVMPNTPAQVGAGMSVWLCAPSVPPGAATQAKAVLGTLGQEVRVDNERYIDMATALSASGPAYVFHFIESLIEAGVYLGLPREMSRTLTLQTVLGSTRLAMESGKHPAELKDMVTSPGGTTAEALLALEDGKFRSTVINAVAAAYRKSVSLGEK